MANSSIEMEPLNPEEAENSEARKISGAVFIRLGSSLRRRLPNEGSSTSKAQKKLSCRNRDTRAFYQLAREGNWLEMHKFLETLPEAERRQYVRGSSPRKGLTALHYTCHFGKIDAAAYLLKSGADVNAVGKRDGMTPLHYAARYSEQTSGSSYQHQRDSCTLEASSKATDEYIALISYLIREKADIDAVDNENMTPLHYAVMKNSYRIAKTLIDAKCDIEAKDGYGRTPLLLAIARDHREIVMLLLSHGADVRVTDHLGDTVIHLAARFGFNGAIEKVLEMAKKPLDIDETEQGTEADQTTEESQFLKSKNKEGDAALHIAATSNQWKTVEILLNHGSDIDETRANDETALHVAARKGHREVVKVLVLKGAKLVATARTLETPLHAHAQCKNNKKIITKEIVHWLTEGAIYEKPDGKDPVLEGREKYGNTPFLSAVRMEHELLIRELAYAGANMSAVDYEGRNCLMLAVERCKPGFMKLLLTNVLPYDTAKTLLFAKDRNMDTVAHIAAKHERFDILKELEMWIAEGSAKETVEAKHPTVISEPEREVLRDKYWDAIYTKNVWGETPLHIAAKEGKNEVVKYLVERNRDAIKDKDEYFNTPLHCAAEAGQIAVVDSLLEAGSDPYIRNSRRSTPLECAVATGRLEVVETFLKHKVLVELPELYRCETTPLHIAAEKGHVDIMKLLLDNGATRGRLNIHGQTCLDVAIKNKSRECCLALLQQESSWRSIIQASLTEDKISSGETPLRTFIRDNPDLATTILDNCISEKTEAGKVHKVYNYEFLEDTYILPGEQILYHDEENNKDHYRLRNPFDRNDKKLLKNAKPYDEDINKIIDNHPLKLMVKCNRLELLKHPLVVQLISYKWQKFGIYYYTIDFLVYFLFLMLLTAFIVIQQPPYGALEFENSTATLTEEDLWNRTICSTFNNLKKPAFCEVTHFVIFVFTILLLHYKFLRIKQKQLVRFTFEDALQLGVKISAAIVVLDVEPCSAITGLRTKWQWILAGLCLFFAWIELLLMVRKLPKYGIFIVMFGDVLKTFLKFFLIFLLLGIAFSLLFYIWLQNKAEFESLWWTSLKTTMMLIGEVDFGSMFFEDNGEHLTIFAAPFLHIFLFCFVIVMTILVMNLLVGLAVDDIKGVQEQAELTSLAMLVDLVLDSERNLFGGCRRGYAVREQSIALDEPAVIWTFVKKNTGGFKAAKRPAAFQPVVEDPIVTIKKDLDDLKEDMANMDSNIAVIMMQMNYLMARADGQANPEVVDDEVLMEIPTRQRSKSERIS